MSQGRYDVPWLNLRAYDNFDLAVILSSITKQWFYYFVYGKSNFCTRPISVQWVGSRQLILPEGTNIVHCGHVSVRCRAYNQS